MASDGGLISLLVLPVQFSTILTVILSYRYYSMVEVVNILHCINRLQFVHVNGESITKNDS